MQFRRCIVFFFCLILIAGIGMVSTTFAQTYLVEEDEEEQKPSLLLLPYVFHTESLETAFGAAAISSGYFQDQMHLFGTALGTTNESYAFIAAGDNIQLPFLNRFFFKFQIIGGKYTSLRSYIVGNPDYPVSEAGSNNSDENDFIVTPAKDAWGVFEFKYVLPMGNAKDSPVHEYIVDRGLLTSNPSGGEKWNPFESGRTFFYVKPFFHRQRLEQDSGDTLFETNGLEFVLEYENTDYVYNPSNGSNLSISVSRDFGWLDSKSSWTVIEAEFSKYFSLGESRFARQRVIAINAWTSGSPTWDEQVTEEGTESVHNPAYFDQPTLGGFWRLRGFPEYRFHDKAAVYYCAEYRYIPRWNPIGDISWLKFLKFDWWQIVGFVEVGRVADEWNIKELHTDMKADVGLGFRAMVSKVVVRFDMGFSEEGWNMWAMVSQPF